MAGRPARFNGECAGAVKGVGCAVGCGGDPAAGVGAGHAEGEGGVGDQVVAAPWGVADDGVRFNLGRCREKGEGGGRFHCGD